MGSPDDLALPRHPAEAQNRRVLAIGTGAMLLGVVAALAGAAVLTPGLLAFGGLFAWLGGRALQSVRVVQLNNLAYDHLTRGELDAAAGLLARAEGKARGYVRRAVRVQQALVALSRGVPEEALAAATEAAQGGTSMLTRSYELRMIASALAIRAVAHAALGRAAEAEADARAATSAPEAGAEALGRAALARMILASRAEDLDALAQLLRTNARATTNLLPRERVLVRAFRRMLAAGGTVYRRPARREEPAHEGALHAWARAVAPAAASFVEAGGAGVSPGGPVPIAAPTRQAEEALTRDRGLRLQAAEKTRARRVRLLVGLWLGLAVTLFGLFELAPSALDGAPGVGAVASLAGTTGGLVFDLAVLTLVAAFVMRLRRAERAGAELQRASRLAAAGDLEGAARVGRELLAARHNPVTKAGAHFALAELAEESARFEEAAREVALGIQVAEAQPAWRAAASDILLPELHGARAWLLAREGRVDDANAELELLAREFPTYPFATRTRHRVRLVAAVATGDLDAAHDLVRTRAPEMPLSLRDELLGDLVLATTDAAAPEGERERIATELREDARLAAWVSAVAPRLAGSLGGAPAARVAPSTEDDAHDEVDAPAEASSARGEISS